ncbi:prenyltransferase [Bdellovibrio sp. SKB1291214]|uniref:prenyltransferase n=1 Tax=Bdellovibrio sp. SKB1291214 TaxID=1732569 RepID=UPI000B51682D|nr:prenyltransferase [Bdellovibrio sp. SKB1291214]UYL10097.1 prenyltransferase [Bdellovibrio sp. SKB1291214]
MSEFVTLSKSSPQFESYLLGTFAKDKRALPVQTLNVNSASETVTFKIVPVSSLEFPPRIVRIMKTVKFRSFLFILVPLFLILTKNIADQTIRDPISCLIATIGVIFAFISVNLRNDYTDHVRGVDRVLERSGSRAIQNGWTTASHIKNLSTTFLILSLMCAVPVMMAYNEVAYVVVVGAIIGLWAQFQKRISFKYKIGGEISLFLMFGPLLTVGYQLAMGAPFDKESLWIGVVWGWAVLFVVHLRNFINILPSSQAGFRNTVNCLGFDRSRRLIALWWAIFLCINLFYHLVYAGKYWGIYVSIALVFLSFTFISKLKSLSSPVGGDLRQVFKYGFTLFLFTIGLWVFECLWYLLLAR